MTFKEFSEAVLNDAELEKKFEEAKEAFRKEGIKDKIELLSKAAAKLGFDVPASEFKLKEIGRKEMSFDELDAVTGGVADAGVSGLECIGNFTDTGCANVDFCDLFQYTYNIKSCDSTFEERHCLYTHDGWCWASDACNAANVNYTCDQSYTTDKCSEYHICNSNLMKS